MRPIEDPSMQTAISDLRQKLFDVVDAERSQLMATGIDNMEWAQIVVSAMANVSSLTIICLFGWQYHPTAIKEFGRVLELAYDQNIAELAAQEAADGGGAH